MTAVKKVEEIQFREDMLAHVFNLLKESWFYQISSHDFQGYLKEIRPTILQENSTLKKSSHATDFLVLVVEGEIQKKDSAFGRDDTYKLKRGDTFFFSTFDYLNYRAPSDTIILEVPLDRNFSPSVRAYAQDLDMLRCVRQRPSLLPIFRKYYQTELVKKISQQEVEKTVKIIEVDRNKKLFLEANALYFVDSGKVKLQPTEKEHTKIFQGIVKTLDPKSLLRHSSQFILDLDSAHDDHLVAEAIAIENTKICHYTISPAIIADAVLYLSQVERHQLEIQPPDATGDLDISYLQARDSKININQISKLNPFSKLLTANSANEYWAMSIVNIATLLGSQFTKKMAQELLVHKEVMDIIDIQSVSAYLEGKGIVTRKRILHSVKDELQNKVYVWCRHNKLFLILNNININNPDEILVFETQTGLFSMNRRHLQTSPYLLEIERNQFERHKLEASKSVFDKPDLYGEKFFKNVFDKKDVLWKNLFTFKFFQTVIVLLIPTMIYGYMNQAVTSSSTHLTTGLSLALIVFLLFQAVAIFFYNYYNNEFSSTFRSSLSSFFHKIFLAQKQGQLKVGFIQTRISLAEFAYSSIRFQKTDLPIYIGLLVFYFLYIGWHSVEAGLALVAITLGSLGLVFYLRKKGGFSELNSVQLKQDLMEFYFESLRSLGQFSILSRNDALLKRVSTQLKQTLVGSNEYSIGISRLSLVGTALYKCGSVLILYLVVIEMVRNKLSPMQLFGVSLYMSYLTMPFQAIANYLSNMNTTGLLGLPIQVLRMEGLDPNRKNESFNFFEMIVFSKVYFKYQEKSGFSVTDLNIKFRKNHFHVVLGRSNSGKTTFAKLLAHVIDPQHGQILIDEKDSSLFDRNQVIHELGYCPQIPELATGTIRSNLIPPTTSLRTLEFNELATELGLFAGLKEYQLSLDSEVEVQGLNLPHQIRKKIQLVRYLLQDKKVLVLDDPTLFLSSEDASRLLKYLRVVAKEKTVIVFTHSLEAAQICDMVTVLRAGKIVEEGEFYRLINMSGELAEYFRNQIGEQ